MSIWGFVDISEIYFKKGINKTTTNNPLDMALLPRVRICTWTSIQFELLNGNDYLFHILDVMNQSYLFLDSSIEWKD